MTIGLDQVLYYCVYYLKVRIRNAQIRSQTKVTDFGKSIAYLKWSRVGDFVG